MNGTDFKKYVGENIAKIRKYRGYSQEYLSEAIGISPNSYSRIERGQNFPSSESFAKIIDTLDIQPADLFCFHPDCASVWQRASASGDQRRGASAGFEAAGRLYGLFCSWILFKSI